MKVQVCLGWDESHPTDHVVSCRKLKDEGLHTYRGMLGYCMKDNGEVHFEVVYHNVLAKDTNDNKVGLNNCVSLSHSNILQRAHQWGKFCRVEYLGAILSKTLYHMCKGGQFYSNPTWVILLRFAGMDVRRVASVWKIMVKPNDIDMKVIYNVFFDMVSGIARMRYFNSHTMAHEHEGRKCRLIAHFMRITTMVVVMV